MLRKQKPRLIDQICAPENLLEAWRRVQRNIRVRDRASSRGADGVSIEDFERHLEANLARLARELRESTYRPRPVQRFYLSKRGGGRRTISVLAVRDRVAQRAVQNVIEPLFEAQFLDCSYGFRPGRSVAGAVARLVAYRQAGYTWVLDADIRDCFDSLDHRLLMRYVRWVVREQETCRLIQAWLEAGVMETLADETDQKKRGIPWDGLLGTAAHHLEAALDWGLQQLAGEEELMPYDLDIPSTDYNSPPDHEALRRRALGRLGREALVLGLSFSHPLLDRARRSLPRVRRALRRRSTAVAALASLGVALLPFAYKAMTKDGTADGAVGTPQGAVLSPLLANAYLHQFDRAMTRRGLALVRYADDWCIVGHSRREVERARETAERALARLKLSLNEEKTRILRLDDGFAFLGTRFRANGAHTPVAKDRWLRLQTDARRAMGQAGERARQLGEQTLRTARQQAGQLTDNARRTVRSIAGDLRRIRFFDKHKEQGGTDEEESNDHTVSNRTRLQTEQD